MRSKLFVPASRPELFPKALAGAADALSFDLEDAVAEARKSEARTTLAGALASAEFAASRKTIIVRVNGLATPHFAADLAAVALARVDLINVPKVETADDIRAVATALAPCPRSLSVLSLLCPYLRPRLLRLGRASPSPSPIASRARFRRSRSSEGFATSGAGEWTCSRSPRPRSMPT